MMRSVVILKGKIFHVDNVLPLLFELKAAGLKGDFYFICSSRKEYEALRNNTTTDAALTALGRVTWFEPRRPAGRGLFGRLWSRLSVRRAIRNAWVLRYYVFGGVLSLESEDTPLYRYLMRFNRRVFRGRR